MKSLANPNWTRDIPRLIHFLARDRPEAPGVEQDLIDQATRAAKQYGAAKQAETESAEQFKYRQDHLWDSVLGPIDGFLELRQQEHLRAVSEAGASGRPLPPA